MPRDLFGDVTRPSISIGNRKWYTVPLSLLSHSAIVFAVVVVPLLATDVLPKPWQKIAPPYVTLVPAPPPPPKLRPVDATPRASREAAPIEAPDSITPERPVDFDTSFQDNNAHGIVSGVENIESIVAPPPPPPVAPPPPIRVGTTVRTPQKVRDVHPVYPATARAARVEGTVIIEATIGIDGRLVDTRLLRSIPLLDQAALDAVRQWEFTPSLLNGVPVPVIMTVTVTFKLQ